MIFLCPALTNAQITFQGCEGLFDAQQFTFSNLGLDSEGRNIFETTPIDGNQPCSGVGICEFRIFWNSSMSRWEFVADDGTGDFSNAFLIYFNTSASIPNPPDLTLGTWVENGADTAGGCGGDLTTANSTLSGEVQSTVLGILNYNLQTEISVYPNPGKDKLFLEGNSLQNISDIYVLNMLGNKVLYYRQYLNYLDISKLTTGVYFLKIKIDNNFIQKKIIVQ